MVMDMVHNWMEESFHNVYVHWITTMYTLNIFFSQLYLNKLRKKGHEGKPLRGFNVTLQTWLNKATWKLSLSEAVIL